MGEWEGDAGEMWVGWGWIGGIEAMGGRNGDLDDGNGGLDEGDGRMGDGNGVWVRVVGI